MEKDKEEQSLLEQIEGLKRKEQRWQVVAENIADGLIETDASNKIADVNNQLCGILGFSPKEMKGKEITGFLTEKGKKTFEKELEKHKNGKKDFYEISWKSKENNIIDTIISVIPCFGEDKGFSGILAIITDITERKNIEKTLFSSQMKYRAIFESTNNGVAIYKAVDEGEDFVIVDFNRAGAEIEKVDIGNILGKSILEVFPGVKEFGLFKALQETWKTGKSVHFPTSFYKDERIEGWRDNYIYKLPLGEIVTVYSDETEKKRAEEELREIGEKFKLLFQSIPDAVFLIEQEKGLILDFNNAAVKLYGYTPEELKDLEDHDLFVDRKESIEARNVLSHNSNVYQHKKKSGEPFACEMTYSAFTLSGKRVVIATGRDVSERLRDEQVLAEQSAALEDKNTALKEVLAQIELEKSQIKEKVASNVRELVMPIIKRLRLKGAASKYITLLEKSLEEMTASFGIKISEKKLKLSPREIEIANMIKEGLSSKEIAQLLNISLKTTELYRNNIRRKLGLVRKQVNLTTYLQSL